MFSVGQNATLTQDKVNANFVFLTVVDTQSHRHISNDIKKNFAKGKPQSLGFVLQAGKCHLNSTHIHKCSFDHILLFDSLHVLICYLMFIVLFCVPIRIGFLPVLFK